MDVFKWREELRNRAYELARLVASSVSGTVFLVGSYARGDFAEDSDIDILVVSHFSEPPHMRHLNLRTPPGVEIIALTPEEAFRAVEKCYPIAHDVALGVVLRDDLAIAGRLISTAAKCVNPSQ